MKLRKNLFIIRRFFIKILNSELIRAIPTIIIIIIALIAILIWVGVSQIQLLLSKKKIF
jgi:hypothetical protein